MLLNRCRPTCEKMAMKVIVVSALAAAFLAVAAPQAAARGQSEAVTRWIDVELAEFAAHRTNPPRASRALALVSVAMLDATRVPRGYQRAATAGAAATVLAYVFPDRAAAFDELADRERPRFAVALGRRIGAPVVERARRDGSDAVWQVTVPVGPGLWVPTAPAFAPPLEPLAGTWRTWNISSGSRYRPGPPSEVDATPSRSARSTTSPSR
jgi:hypothetical protein